MQVKFQVRLCTTSRHKISANRIWRDHVWSCPPHVHLSHLAWHTWSGLIYVGIFRMEFSHLGSKTAEDDHNLYMWSCLIRLWWSNGLTMYVYMIRSELYHPVMTRSLGGFTLPVFREFFGSFLVVLTKVFKNLTKKLPKNRNVKPPIALSLALLIL